jgi:hypothetical protein
MAEWTRPILSPIMLGQAHLQMLRPQLFCWLSTLSNSPHKPVGRKAFRSMHAFSSARHRWHEVVGAWLCSNAVPRPHHMASPASLLGTYQSLPDWKFVYLSTITMFWAKHKPAANMAVGLLLSKMHLFEGSVCTWYEVSDGLTARDRKHPAAPSNKIQAWNPDLRQLLPPVQLRVVCHQPGKVLGMASNCFIAQVRGNVRWDWQADTALQIPCIQGELTCIAW